MEPREKAEEIWMKLFQRQIEITGSGDGNLCVEMALIAVDEVIECCKQYDELNETYVTQIDYWTEVKQEIEKL